MNVDSIQISTDLILDHSLYGEDETILLFSAESMGLIADIAEVSQAVHVFDTSFQALRRAEQFLRRENIHFSRAVFPTEPDQYDTAVLFVPKGRDLGRAQLWSALQVLRPDGDCFIAGPNKGGAKTMIRDAATLFGDCNVVAYRKSHRVAVSQKSTRSADQYPSDWGPDPTQPQTRTFETPLGELNVTTLPGIFSWDELDDGTACLLEQLDIRDAQTALDIGCGTGIIGALIARHGVETLLVDENLLAVVASTQTIEQNAITQASVRASDVYSDIHETFDLIVSNPPFHQKFDVNTNTAHRIIRDAKKHLNPGGRLIIVCNAFLPYEAVFDEAFGRHRIITKDHRFKVIEGAL